MRRLLIVLLLLVVFIIIGNAQYVRQGTCIIEDVDDNYEAFDLNLGKVVRTPKIKGERRISLLGDFIWDKYSEGIALGTTDSRWKNVKDLGGQPLASVKSITPLGFAFHVPLVVGHVYCIRTKGYNYALVRLIRFLDNGKKAEFEWKYNYNGSLIFGN